MYEIKRSQLWEKIQEFKEDRELMMAWVCETGAIVKNKYMMTKVATECCAYKKAKAQRKTIWSDGRQNISPPKETLFLDPTDEQLVKQARDETDGEDMETPMDVDEDESASAKPIFMKSFSTLSPGG